MYPNIQAYDRGVMFSPDGRLFQVEYARETVRKGATSVGMVANDGVVLVAHKDVLQPLAEPKSLQKIFRVDQSIGATYSGLASDGLHIINSMRNKTQTHRMIYNETESVETVAREIAEEMQMATQYGGIRPYAVALLIGGVDKNPVLYEVDPSAAYLGYKADAIGSGKQVAQDILLKNYKEGMDVDEAIKLGVSIIKKVNEGKLNENNIDISTIKKGIGYENFGIDKVAKYL